MPIARWLQRMPQMWGTCGWMPALCAAGLGLADGIGIKPGLSGGVQESACVTAFSFRLPGFESPGRLEVDGRIGLKISGPDGTVLRRIPFPAPFPTSPRLLPVDVDGDGRLDCLVVPGVGDPDPGAARVLLMMDRGAGMEWVTPPARFGSGGWRDAVVGDFDGDGVEDVAVADPDGRCRVWTGDGQGGWQPSAWSSLEECVKPILRITVIDRDDDGIPDLMGWDASGGRHTFSNPRGRPGLRVRLVGRTGLKDGVGSVIRLRTGTRWGPARRVVTPMTLLAAPGSPTGIEVRWEDGRVTTAELGGEPSELTVAGDGVMGR
jgi:hypothetical protein